MRKKVAFLDYSSVFAGAERVLFNMIAHIDRTKYEPILVFPYPMLHHVRYKSLDCEMLYLTDSIKWWMGSDRWRHPLRGTDFLKRFEFGIRLFNIVKKQQIDIVDVNLVRGDVLMWVWATSKFTKAKIVGHYRSQSQAFVPPASAQRFFDEIACVSEFSRNRFRLKGDHTHTSVLYDSVDVDVFKSSMTKDEAKLALGYEKDSKILVSVGQLSLHKGHDNAIRAFARICGKFPNARLLIAGGGGSQIAESYRSLAKKLGVSDKVRVSGEQRADIQTVYRAADLTLSLTKVGEGFGLVPYESVLMGTPFIAPCFGAITEFVEDQQNGLLVDTNDVNAITDKIVYALTNPEETNIMVNRLNALVHSHLHPKVLADNLDKLYSSLWLRE